MPHRGEYFAAGAPKASRRAGGGGRGGFPTVVRPFLRPPRTFDPGRMDHERVRNALGYPGQIEARAAQAQGTGLSHMPGSPDEILEKHENRELEPERGLSAVGVHGRIDSIMRKSAATIFGAASFSRRLTPTHDS